MASRKVPLDKRLFAIVVRAGGTATRNQIRRMSGSNLKSAQIDAGLKQCGDLIEAKVLIERWRREYNQVRPHSALGYRPPAPEAIWPLPPSSAPLHPVAMALGLT